MPNDTRTPAEIHRDVNRAAGRLSDEHIALVKRVAADATNPYEYRKLMWATTKDALDLIGRPFEPLIGPEPVEGSKP